MWWNNTDDFIIWATPCQHPHSGGSLNDSRVECLHLEVKNAKPFSYHGRNVQAIETEIILPKTTVVKECRFSWVQIRVDLPEIDGTLRALHLSCRAQPILVALAFCVASLSRCLRRRRRLWRLSSLGRRKVPVNVAYGEGEPCCICFGTEDEVQLAVSVLGGVPGATAYHSSVIVNGHEYFFSDGGIASTSDLSSHKNPQMPDSKPEVIDMGMSPYTGSQMREALERYFISGTYDLLRKNCNSFSDCALFYLLHKRLDKKYRAMEKLGASFSGVVQAGSGGQYQPNPKADGFDVEKVCEAIDPDKLWKTPGQATGGSTVSSAEEMRNKRLARLTGGGGGYAGEAQGGQASAAAGAPAPPPPPPPAAAAA
ncbi:Hypothetical protein SCF082_LOCUS12395 [Durusdinium trenchii]|uniref:PPPDE domain-containing protein n=1 Tax=Durusdinium trenchii TaxID=1381693 RepID=A0ABP0JJU4_9DINO